MNGAATNRAASHAPLSDERALAWAKFGVWDRMYFPALIGLEVQEIRTDYCRMIMPFKPELEQPAGVVHGGAIASILDAVVVPAVGSGYDRAANYSTVDMHVQFLSALVREDAIAEGWIVKRGRSVVFCEAEVVGATSGKLIAKSMLTYNVKMLDA